MLTVFTRGLLLLTASLFLGCAGTKTEHSITLTNPSTVDQSDALIVLTRAEIEAKTGPLNKAFIQVTQEHQPLTVQFDDLDQDGSWDEAVLLYSLKAGQSVELALVKTDQPPKYEAVVRAHVRMKLKDNHDQFGPAVKKLDMPPGNLPTDFSKHKLPPYLTEGPGWENDKVAFRLYFDTRNNKDIYGKRIAGMVLDSVGANPNNSYHKLSGWGMDILKVGSSLGAGALAFHYTRPDGRDTLVRLAGTDILGETFQQIADGPVRSIFRMGYKWQLENKPVTVTEWISIWGGQYFYQSKVAISGEIPAGLKIDMGIADFYENQLDSIKSNKAAILYSYGKQSENHDPLGMAILTPAKETNGFWHLGDKPTDLTDITDSYLSEQSIGTDTQANFRFYACWSKSAPEFSTLTAFKKYLDAEVATFDQPIVVQLK